MRIVELLRITNKNFKVSNRSSLISDCFFLLYCDFLSVNVLSYFASQPQHFFLPVKMISIHYLFNHMNYEGFANGNSIILYSNIFCSVHCNIFVHIALCFA